MSAMQKKDDRDHIPWEKVNVENIKLKAVLNCFNLDPWNSSFVGYSLIHTTRPVKKINIVVAIQRSFVSGSKKIHMDSLSLFLASTSIDTPDSVYGIVKSTSVARLAIIVTSPTAASNSCRTPRKAYKMKQVNME